MLVYTKAIIVDEHSAWLAAHAPSVRRDWLEHERDEAGGALAIFLVGLPEHFDKRGFLDLDAVGVGDSHDAEKSRQPGPVSQSQSNAREGDEHARVRRVAHIGIGSRLNHRLPRLGGDSEREEFAQGGDRVITKRHSREHQSDTGEKDRVAMPENAGLWQSEREGEIQGQRDVQENENDDVRATVFSLHAATRPLGERPEHFRAKPQTVGGPEEGGEDWSRER